MAQVDRADAQAVRRLATARWQDWTQSQQNHRNSGKKGNEGTITSRSIGGLTALKE
jgi:hypothetical protein